MFIIFDTETTGLPKDPNKPLSDSDNWPRLVQLAWQVHGNLGELIEAQNHIVKPNGYTIPYNAAQIHGITTERAMEEGIDLADVLGHFEKSLEACRLMAGHNLEFDLKILGAEHFRLSIDSRMGKIPHLDTKDESTDYCKIPGGKGGGFKWPTLSELHEKLFGEGFSAAHNAAADVEATGRCFLELIRIGVIKYEKAGLDAKAFEAFSKENPKPFSPIGLNIKDHKVSTASAEVVSIAREANEEALHLAEAFVHLHVHSQFSVLQSTSDVNSVVKQAEAMGMKAVALCDLGNMYGAFSFVNACEKAGIKPIIGYEAYVCENRHDRSRQDNGYRIPLIALNKTGYANLSKLSSIAFSEGFYYVPRIDREVLLKYKEGIAVLSGSTGGEVPHLLLNVGDHQAEDAFVWWKTHFGEHFYAELQRHGLPEEEVVNTKLLEFCERHQVEYLAANECFYLLPEDADAQDILLCVKDGVTQNTPIGRGRGYRFGMPNKNYYFLSKAEMAERFADLPQALANTGKLVDKVEQFSLKRPVLLPNFDIPEAFVHAEDALDGGKRGENAYLRHLTYEGAKKRYKELTDEIRERLDFELSIIEKTGYPGYFLIVQDFTNKAWEMGVWVGPGRGSAAGSVVAYCTGITNVDPLKYGLLFERFLNPDRVSLPDIDIDFDNEGREKVIQYVIDKYGKEQVAQIITYGTMAAKSALRDASRVKALDLTEVNRLAKLIPDNASLKDIFGLDESALKERFNADQLKNIAELREIAKQNSPWSEMLKAAMRIEGSLRTTGIHACGVIITPTDMSSLVPVMMPKDSSLMATQFDNYVVEDAGLLKMDFLGLRTLSILKTAIEIIKKAKDIEIKLDDIPLDDTKTMELFAKGETTALFQFESPGMQKNLRMLKPTVFEDIIAMNALYRPGPMEYIPDFAKRKNGIEAVQYDLPIMAEVLKETYGVTVYQEQVMQLSRLLADFTRGEADKLRKAMGKKIKAQLDELKPKFIEGATKNGHPEKTLHKIWEDWEKFAKYAFNKSHAACYSVVAWQTAYLKAHYPAEFMAAVLSHNMTDIKKLGFFMEECKRMGLQVLGPDVNESQEDFSVNKLGQIRFGLSGMNGVGQGVAMAIRDEREKNGFFTSFFDFLSRMDARSVSKQTLQSLIFGGAFDSLTNGRRSVFFVEEDGKPFIEKAVRYAQSLRHQKESAQGSLFDDMPGSSLPEPQLPNAEEWSRKETLKREKDVLGLFLSSHPLDDFKYELNHFSNIKLEQLKTLTQNRTQEYVFGGLITQVKRGTSKAGNDYCVLTIEDYSDQMELFFMGEEYLKFQYFFNPDLAVLVKATADVRELKQIEEGQHTHSIRFKVSKMLLLNELLEKQVKGLVVMMPLIDFKAETFESWISTLNASETGESGKHELELRLFHDQMELRLADSGQLKLRLTSDLFKKLEEAHVPFMLMS